MFNDQFSSLMRQPQFPLRFKNGNLPYANLEGHLVQRLLKVGNDVVNVLNTHRHAQLRGHHTGRQLRCLGQLLVRGGRGLNDEGFGIAHVG